MSNTDLHSQEGTPRTDAVIQACGTWDSLDFVKIQELARTLELENLSLQRRLEEAERLLNNLTTHLNAFWCAEGKASESEGRAMADDIKRAFSLAVAHLARHQTSGGSP